MCDVSPVPLISDVGERMLRESVQFHTCLRLLQYFETQQTLTFCGVASMTTVLNTLGVARPVSDVHGSYRLFTQNNLFSDRVEAIRPRAMVERAGMPLGAMAAILESCPAEVRCEYASDCGIDRFRSDVSSMGDATSYVIVNYYRPALGQDGGGHISPIGAYCAEADRVLVLDVARYRYPPIWVRVEDMWRAMSETVDGESKRSRGYVVVRAKDADRA